MKGKTDHFLDAMRLRISGRAQRMLMPMGGVRRFPHSRSALPRRGIGAASTLGWVVLGAPPQQNRFRSRLRRLAIPAADAGASGAGQLLPRKGDS